MGEHRIYKYSLGTLWASMAQDITIPMGATVLSAGFQTEEIVIWAIIDRRSPLVSRRFSIIPTGPDLEKDPEYMTFIQTIFVGSMVFHVFDLGEIRRGAGGGG